jgi:methionyl-tRNA synthetase
LKKGKEPLFIRPEPMEDKTEHEESKKKSTVISIDDVAQVHLNVGTIISCEPVEKSDKLLKLKVDFGKLGERQIFAGIAKFFNPEDLIGNQGVFVTNLKPRTMMGSVSQGMMLVAKDEKGNVSMTTVSGDVENGTRLS